MNVDSFNRSLLIAFLIAFLFNCPFSSGIQFSLNAAILMTSKAASKFSPKDNNGAWSFFFPPETCSASATFDTWRTLGKFCTARDSLIHSWCLISEQARRIRRFREGPRYPLSVAVSQNRRLLEGQGGVACAIKGPRVSIERNRWRLQARQSSPEIHWHSRHFDSFRHDYRRFKSQQVNLTIARRKQARLCHREDFVPRFLIAIADVETSQSEIDALGDVFNRGIKTRST